MQRINKGCQGDGQGNWVYTCLRVRQVGHQVYGRGFSCTYVIRNNGQVRQVSLFCAIGHMPFRVQWGYNMYFQASGSIKQREDNLLGEGCNISYVTSRGTISFAVWGPNPFGYRLCCKYFYFIILVVRGVFIPPGAFVVLCRFNNALLRGNVT